MTENTTTPEATADTSVDGSTVTEAQPETKPVFAKGTWQEALQQSTTLLDRSTKARKRASSLLWTGAKDAIGDWLTTADTDVAGENLYNEVLDILGKPRKGDASKVKTVAVAVKDHGLVLATFENLSKAYAEASRLTKTVKVQAAEDDAAEKAIESIEAPSTTSTVDGAAAILLSKGVDGAVVAILDALGKDNEAAHRAFLRAVSVEIAARVQAAKPKPVVKVPTPKGAATKAKPVAAKTATAKPKTGTKAKPVPVSASKGDPNAKALSVKAQPVKAKAAPVVIKR